MTVFNAWDQTWGQSLVGSPSTFPRFLFFEELGPSSSKGRAPRSKERVGQRGRPTGLQPECAFENSRIDCAHLDWATAGSSCSAFSSSRAWSADHRKRPPGERASAYLAGWMVQRGGKTSTTTVGPASEKARRL